MQLTRGLIVDLIKCKSECICINPTVTANLYTTLVLCVMIFISKKDNCIRYWKDKVHFLIFFVLYLYMYVVKYIQYNVVCSYIMERLLRLQNKDLNLIPNEPEFRSMA